MRFDSIDDLPECLRERARLELLKNGGWGSELSKKSVGNVGREKKYNNRLTFVGNLKFDSKREAERFEVLLIRLKAGEIEKLKLQPEFTITESYIMPDGRRVKAQRYRADFSYYVKESGEYVVEDVKTEGTRTRVFINKQKLVYEKYGIDVKLV